MNSSFCLVLQRCLANAVEWFKWNEESRRYWRCCSLIVDRARVDRRGTAYSGILQRPVRPWIVISRCSKPIRSGDFRSSNDSRLKATLPSIKRGPFPRGQKGLERRTSRCISNDSLEAIWEKKYPCRTHTGYIKGMIIREHT